MYSFKKEAFFGINKTKLRASFCLWGFQINAKPKFITGASTLLILKLKNVKEILENTGRCALLIK